MVEDEEEEAEEEYDNQDENYKQDEVYQDPASVCDLCSKPKCLPC